METNQTDYWCHCTVGWRLTQKNNKKRTPAPHRKFIDLLTDNTQANSTKHQNGNLTPQYED